MPAGEGFAQHKQQGVGNQGRLRSSSAAAVWRAQVADKVGIGLSGLCLIHCLATPLVILLIPSIQGENFHDLVHLILLAVLPLVALAAFIPGFRRHHDVRVFAWAVPGIFLIALGALAFQGESVLETSFSILGSLGLIRAHWLNRSLCACCKGGKHGAGHKLIRKAEA